MRGHRDLGAVCIAAIVAALVAALVPWEGVRILAALPLAIFLPGYAISAAAFGSQRFDLERLAMLILLCSISTLCLGGILLNFLPGGIRTVSWALLLVLVTVAASRVAAVRRAEPASQPQEWTRPRIRRWDLACVLIAVAAVTGALVFAYTPLPASKAIGYTALWMLPGKATAAPAVKVGVISAEQEPQRYRLRVRVGDNGKPIVYRLSLDPGEERVFRVPVDPAAKGPTRVAASLYDTDHPQKLYRRVTTWTPTKAKPDDG